MCKYVLVSQGIECNRSNNPYDIISEAINSNKEYNKYRARCIEEYERPADNEMFVYKEERDNTTEVDLFEMEQIIKCAKTEAIEEVFGKIEERLNDSTTVTFDLPVEDVLGDNVDMDDFLMLAEEIVQEYKNLIFSKLKQAKKQLKENNNE